MPLFPSFPFPYSSSILPRLFPLPSLICKFSSLFLLISFSSIASSSSSFYLFFSPLPSISSSIPSSFSSLLSPLPSISSSFPSTSSFFYLFFSSLFLLFLRPPLPSISSSLPSSFSSLPSSFYLFFSSLFLPLFPH